MRSRCFYWRKELGSVDLWSTLNIFVKSTQNFLETFEKKVSPQKNGVLSEYSNPILSFVSTSFSEVKLFFRRSLENFVWTLRTRSRYFKGPPNLVLYVSKKIVAARHTNQIICQEKWKKLGFWKKWSSKWGWNILSKPHFLSWNFFFKGL